MIVTICFPLLCNARSIFSLVLLFCLAFPATAATLQVGAGKAFSRVEQAVAAARPGDVIEVYPLPHRRAYQAVGVLVNKPNLTIRAAGVEPGQRVTLSGRGFEHSGQGRTPRAIVEFRKKAHHGVLEGFELTGGSNRSNNGAGVRINKANHVTIRNCDIHGNDMGIMSNGDGSPNAGVNQVIEYSAIHHNGRVGAPGYNHNLYLGGTSVMLRFSEVAYTFTGHNVKSRAYFNRIEYSYVHHSGHREFDLVDARDTTRPGSHAVLLDNIIVKDPQSRGNRGVIHFGQEGEGDHNGTLYLAFNTIVTPFASPVVDLSSAGARAILRGNIFDDGGRKRNNQRLASARRGGASLGNISGVGNWFAPGFARGLNATDLADSGNTLASRSESLYVNPAAHDYRLREPWPGIVASGETLLPGYLPPTPGSEEVEPGLKWQYIHPLGRAPRPSSDRPDLGELAYQPAQRHQRLSETGTRYEDRVSRSDHDEVPE